MLPQVRLYLRYGNYSRDNNGTKDKAESFGFDFRLYFGSMVEEVALQPIVRLVYNGALGKQHNKSRVQAVNAMNSDYNTFTRAWDVKLLTALGLTANSDIVSLYFEPSLGLDITQSGSDTQKNFKETYGLAYDVYAEIYITPIKNLEWYFEAEIGNVWILQPLVISDLTELRELLGIFLLYKNDNNVASASACRWQYHCVIQGVKTPCY